MLPTLRNNVMPAPFAGAPVNRLSTLFDSVLGTDGGFLGQASFGMPMAMWEDEDHIFIEAEIPGVAEEDLDVTVHNGMLFIRGERRPEEGRRYLYNDRPYGRFEKVVTLPEAVNSDEVQAALTNGVLRIDLPKSPEAKPKKITLRTS